MKPVQKSNPIGWSEAQTLEEWVECKIREGNFEIVKYMMKGLPEERQNYYRDLYRKVKEEKK